MGKYIRGNVDERFALGTLAARTGIIKQFDDVVNERTLVSSLQATWAMTDFTSATGDGPIYLGVAHGDYTLAEIEEFIETTNSWDEGNLISQEIAKRKIRIAGIIQSSDAPADVQVLNDGKPVKLKLNWILLQSQTLQAFAYNSGSSALATTDPQVTIVGHANLFPK